MSGAISLVLTFAFGTALAACTHTYSRPVEPAFSIQAPTPGFARTASVFADRDGTLYASNWVTLYPEAERFASIRRAAGPDRQGEVDAGQAALIADVADAMEGRRTVFILIHGFRDPQPGSDDSIRALMQAVALGPDDGVIAFHWDGLQSSEWSVGQIWFESAGNSQLAGVRALRPLLARLHDTHIVMIAHSRGASVILSAL